MTPLSGDDERGIAAVITAYATAIDRRDWASLRRCFADDFVGDYGDGKCWIGPEAITRYMIERHAGVGATLHRLSNIVSWSTPAGAGARSYVDALLMPGPAKAPAVEAIGWYDDELVRGKEGWLISRRRFTLVRLREA